MSQVHAKTSSMLLSENHGCEIITIKELLAFQVTIPGHYSSVKSQFGDNSVTVFNPHYALPQSNEDQPLLSQDRKSNCTSVNIVCIPKRYSLTASEETTTFVKRFTRTIATLVPTGPNCLAIMNE